MRARALAIAVLLLGASLVAHAGASLDAHVVALRLTPVASAPPPLSLKRLEDGRTITLGDLTGRPVLLYFWATW